MTKKMEVGDVVNVRELGQEFADIANDSAACDLPDLITGACSEAVRSALRDDVVRAALNCYIDSLREQILDKHNHPDLLCGLEDDLNIALGLASL